MSNIQVRRSQPNLLSTPMFNTISSALKDAVLVAHDLRGFVRLLLRTLSSLPADVLAASVLINLLGLALPLAILQVYDRLVPNAATATLTLLILGVFCAVALETVLRVARGYVVAWSGMKLAWNASIDAASRIATAPAELVDSQPAAQWIQRLHAVSIISEFYISPSPLVLIDLVFAAIFLVLLMIGSGWLAAVPLVIFFVFGLVAIQRGRTLRGATAGRISAEARIRDFLIEVLNGIVTVKALGAEQQILRRFERLSQQAAAHTHEIVRLADDAQSFASIISVLTQIATATIGAILAVKGEISIGVVACSTMLAGRVIQPLLRLVSAWNEIQGVLVAEETAKPIFNLPHSGRVAMQATRGEHQPASVVFDNVWYAQGGGQVPVLARASLNILPGEIISITGRDDIGKSTVARLAAGQLTPNYGSVLVDGIAVHGAAGFERGTVAIVDSGNAIIRGSVLNNLTLFRDAEQLEAARAAVRVVGLESEINRLPHGYDTPLGGAASETLPTGFLQRIVIARAIAGRPRLLILDEANNGFDHASDQALIRGLVSLRGKITIILITNRPSFASIADRQFTLADGLFCRIQPLSLSTKVVQGGAG
jgi:ATP-binding cassette, subfamily C, bacterial LapB